MQTTTFDVPFDLDDEQRDRATSQLQAWLPDLIAVALRLKQAHWNLRGSRFKSIHEQLDEILVDLRDASDDVAERIVTLGGVADGRPQTVADDSNLPEFPAGLLSVAQVVELCCADLAAAVRHGRRVIAELSELDPISEDLGIGVVAKLEKHHWLLRSQRDLGPND